MKRVSAPVHHTPQLPHVVLKNGPGEADADVTRQRLHHLCDSGLRILDPVSFIHNDSGPFQTAKWEESGGRLRTLSFLGLYKF